MNPYLPPRNNCSYGTVVINDSASEVLLMEIASGHEGYVWTFAKGMSGLLGNDRPDAVGDSHGRDDDKMECPEAIALRKSEEEYGQEIHIVRPIPRWFAGRDRANFFFLAHAGAGRPGGRSRNTRWFSWEKARQALGETQVPQRRDLDLDILEAAKMVACGRKLPFQLIEWNPGPIQIKPADGYPGNLQIDLQDFWKGLRIAATNGETANSFLTGLKQSGEEMGDPLLVQAFFLANAVLLRQMHGAGSPELSQETERDIFVPWWVMIGTRGIRRAFYSIYGGPMTGKPGTFWDAAEWCRIAAGWVPDFILNADKEPLAAWCETIASTIADSSKE